MQYMACVEAVSESILYGLMCVCVCVFGPSFNALCVFVFPSYFYLLRKLSSCGTPRLFARSILSERTREGDWRRGIIVMRIKVVYVVFHQLSAAHMLSGWIGGGANHGTSAERCGRKCDGRRNSGWTICNLQVFVIFWFGAHPCGLANAQ